MVRYFLLGLLVGWLAEWVIDWVWWRRRGDGPVRGEGPTGREAGGAAATASRAEPAARAARPAGELTVIEGIGPRMADLLGEAGIRSLADLAVTPVSRLVGILADAGSSFRRADPRTWPDQAVLAARGEWEALERMKAELRGGVRMPAE